jgi:ribosomal protein L37AE/L43A
MAKRVLADPPKFGDWVQSAARKILEEYQEVSCPHCHRGIVSQSRVGRYECQVCEGTGRTWRRRT